MRTECGREAFRSMARAALARAVSSHSPSLSLSLLLSRQIPCFCRLFRSGNHPYGKLNDPPLPLRFQNTETHMQNESAKIIFQWVPFRNFNPLISDGMIIHGNILRKSRTWLIVDFTARQRFFFQICKSRALWVLDTFFFLILSFE